MDSPRPISGIVPLYTLVSQAATAQKVTVPPQLSHAVLFYTAGELTARGLEAQGIAYTAFADDKFLAGMCGAGCRDKIVGHWGPRLDGKRSVPEGLSALVAAFN